MKESQKRQNKKRNEYNPVRTCQSKIRLGLPQCQSVGFDLIQRSIGRNRLQIGTDQVSGIDGSGRLETIPKNFACHSSVA